MSTKHLVFFTQLYCPDMTTTATIMTDLCEELASYGINTEVICAQPTYLKDLGIQEFRNLGIGGSLDLVKSPKVECHHGVAIRRVWTFLFDKNNNIGIFRTIVLL